MRLFMTVQGGFCANEYLADIALQLLLARVVIAWDFEVEITSKSIAGMLYFS